MRSVFRHRVPNQSRRFVLTSIPPLRANVAHRGSISAPIGPRPIASTTVESRWVLHLDMDAFFASVEQLTRPTLRGRPVLVGGLGGRGVVAGASYEARPFGARSAMPMHQARRMVGAAAVVLPPRGVVYGVASGKVLDTVRAVVPVLEQLSFDEAFGEPTELAGGHAEGGVRVLE